MRTAEAFYKIFMYLHNKNILEYVEIVVTGGNSKIRNIEGHPRIYVGNLIGLILNPTIM